MEVEGITQYRLDYRPGALPAFVGQARWRHRFKFCRKQVLIGQDPACCGGYPYSEIGRRVDGGFTVTRTQSGGQPDLKPDVLARVPTFDTLGYSLLAGAPSRPSLKAMAHA